MLLALSAFLWTAMVAVLPLPAEGPAVANALLFQAPLAVALTWAGSLFGASLSFELSRRGGRPLAHRWLSPGARARVDRVAQGAGWLGWLGLRLVPAASFTGLNWAAGIASVARPTFYWTTAFGILPGCIAFTILAQRGVQLVPEAGLPALGAVLVALALLRWVSLRRSGGSTAGWWRDPRSLSPLALRFRLAALGGVLLAASLAWVAPSHVPNESAPLASAQCSGAGEAGSQEGCCPLLRAKGSG